MKETISLMAIDHAKWLFKSLCDITEPISFNEFEQRLIKVSNNEITKGSRSVEMHLYWLTTLNFLRSKKKAKSTYELTPYGKKFCELYNNPKTKKKYKNYLRSNLIRNSRLKPFVEKFINLIKIGVKNKQPRSISDVEKEFSGEPNTAKGTVRALLTLCKESDMITENNGKLGIKSNKEKKINLLKFKKELEGVYYSLVKQKRKAVEPKKIYVEIRLLRDIILSVLGISDSEFFDLMLKKLLDSSLGKNIHVYGSAPQWFTKHEKDSLEKITFRHKGKIQVYLSIS